MFSPCKSNTCKAFFAKILIKSNFQFLEQSGCHEGCRRDREEIFGEFPFQTFQKFEGEQGEPAEDDAHADESHEQAQQPRLARFCVFELDEFMLEGNTDRRADCTGAKLDLTLVVGEEESKPYGKKGEQREDERNFALVFAVHPVPKQGEQGTQYRADEHVGGVMYAEVQAGAHHADGEYDEQDGRPLFADMAGGGDEQPRAHLRMSAGEGGVGIQTHRGDEGIVHFHSRNQSRRVRAGTGDQTLQAAVDGHGREGYEDQSFAELFIHDPVDQTDKRDEEERFPEQGENASHDGGEFRAHLRDKL